jgi:microcystin degradation protein MlrC
VGAQIALRFGGKSGPDGGEPIDARVEVRAAPVEGWQSFRASRVTLGRAAVIRIIGTEVDVILITSRTQTYDPSIYANQGIDFASKPLLVVKSTNHFYAAFASVASEIIYVAAPTSYPNNPAVTDYKKLDRPIWPRVPDPLG